MNPPIRITIYLRQTVSMAGFNMALLESRSNHIVVGINIIINLSILVKITRCAKLIRVKFSQGSFLLINGKKENANWANHTPCARNKFYDGSL